MTMAEDGERLQGRERSLLSQDRRFTLQLFPPGAGLAIADALIAGGRCQVVSCDGADTKVPTAFPGARLPRLVWVVQHELDGAAWAAVRDADAASWLRNLPMLLSWKSNLALLEQRAHRHRCGLDGGQDSNSTSTTESDGCANTKRRATLVPDGLRPLETFILAGIPDLEAWCRRRFGSGIASSSGSRNKQLWVLKDALANGASAVWLLTPASWRAVVEGAAALYGRSLEARDTEFVVQEHVQEPLLWPPRWRGTGEPGPVGCKFHLRVYAAVFGDGRLLVSRTAFAHVANRPHCPPDDTTPAFEPTVHLTNVAVNVHGCVEEFHRYPVVQLDTECPELWRQITEILSGVLAAARPFSSHQRAAADFVHIGADFLPDSAGRAWLLELNVPPCVGAQSSSPGYSARVAAVVGPQVRELAQIALHRDEPCCIQRPSTSLPPPSTAALQTKDHGQKCSDNAMSPCPQKRINCGLTPTEEFVHAYKQVRCQEATTLAAGTPDIFATVLASDSDFAPFWTAGEVPDDDATRWQDYRQRELETQRQGWLSAVPVPAALRAWCRVISFCSPE